MGVMVGNWPASGALKVALSGLVMWVLAGCAHDRPAAPDHSVGASVATEAEAPKAMSRAAPGGFAGGAPEPGPADAAVSPDAQVTLARFEAARPDRMLIRNASAIVEVADARKALADLTAAARELGGYVGNLQEHVDPLGARSVTVEVRVPVARFEEALQRAENLGKALRKDITADDVTEEFSDADARMRNLKRAEQRLLEHLGRSGRLRDTLDIERELTRVREQIERIEGRLRYLSHRIAFSTLSVTLQEAPRQRTLAPPETFSTAGVVGEATRSLVGFALALWSGVVWIGIWAAVWLPLALLVWFAARRFVRRPALADAPPDSH